MKKAKLFVIACLLTGCANSDGIPKNKDVELKNVIIIGWDGAQRSRVESLLKDGKLPNLKSIIDRGTWVAMNIGTDMTETKPGWAQILSGYSARITGVVSNRIYSPIPKGLTIFERIHGQFKKKIKYLFLAGKDENLGFRGPHNVCMNCISRFNDTLEKTRWYDETADVPLAFGKKKILNYRDGEPFYFLSKSGVLDFSKNALWEGENVLNIFLKEVDKIKKDIFLAFVHFQEPDELGHVYGEKSPQYAKSIEENDMHLGKILHKLELENLIDKTIVMVVTDHGFDRGEKTHREAPEAFLVTSLKNLKSFGDRLDFAPTIYSLYGIEVSKFSPKLEGQTLFK